MWFLILFIGFTFHTGNTKKYEEALYIPLTTTSKSITFTVCAKNDAHVGFICGNQFYEIVIGGWANTKSVIRRKPLGTYHADAKNSASTSGILDGNVFQPFWAQALNGLVRFGTGQIIGQHVVLQWQDPNPIIPDSIGFMTGWGSSGDWSIQDLGLYVQKF